MAVTARYWRVRELVPAADDLLFGEFQFAETVSSFSQVAITGLVLSTTVPPTTGTAQQINDGDRGSYAGWTPTGALEITWDFGSDRVIGAYACTIS